MVPTKEHTDVLRMISRVLDSKYLGSRPRPTDLYWSPGQLCIGRCSVDQGWHRSVRRSGLDGWCLRGQVLEVEQQGHVAKVLFVDYGTEEWCEAGDLRKGLYMTEVPVQAVPVRLQGVQPPSEQWTRQALDFLHELVVDRVSTL